MEKNRTIMPSQLEILIHYYYTPSEYRYYDADIFARIIVFLLNEGLLMEFDDGYTTTERGKIYVETLLTVPLPRQIWVIDEKE